MRKQEKINVTIEPNIGFAVPILDMTFEDMNTGLKFGVSEITVGSMVALQTALGEAITAARNENQYATFQTYLHGLKR